MQIETRTIKLNPKTEGRRVSGYAVIFNAPTIIHERAKTFTEVVRPNSLKLADDLRLLWSHDPANVLASVQGGTLTVRQDERGLYYDAELPESANREREALARGDVDGMSFGFTINKDKWDGNTRELLAITVREISIVAYPAYKETSAHLRSCQRRRLEFAEKELL